MRRRKGAPVQCKSRKFQSVNPLFHQQMVLHTVSFLKSSSPSTCTSLYTGLLLWNEMCYICVVFSPHTDFFAEYLWFFSILFYRLSSYQEFCFFIPLFFDMKKILSYSIKRCSFAFFFFFISYFLIRLQHSFHSIGFVH